MKSDVQMTKGMEIVGGRRIEGRRKAIRRTGGLIKCSLSRITRLRNENRLIRAVTRSSFVGRYTQIASPYAYTPDLHFYDRGEGICAHKVSEKEPSKGEKRSRKVAKSTNNIYLKKSRQKNIISQLRTLFFLIVVVCITFPSTLTTYVSPLTSSCSKICTL